jgi:hypothetical protein
MPGISQLLHQWTSSYKDVSIVVTGHSTRSIAVYATRLSQVRNDYISFTVKSARSCMIKSWVVQACEATNVH